MSGWLSSLSLRVDCDYCDYFYDFHFYFDSNTSVVAARPPLRLLALLQSNRFMLPAASASAATTAATAATATCRPITVVVVVVAIAVTVAFVFVFHRPSTICCLAYSAPNRLVSAYRPFSSFLSNCPRLLGDFTHCSVTLLAHSIRNIESPSPPSYYVRTYATGAPETDFPLRRGQGVRTDQDWLSFACRYIDPRTHPHHPTIKA